MLPAVIQTNPPAAKTISRRAPAWHAEAAQLIRDNFADISKALFDATRRAVWLGLLLQQVKARGKADGSIPHGQFRRWVETNIPDLPYRTTSFYLTIGKGALEAANLQPSKGQILPFCQPGRLPKEIEPIIEGKTQQQLFLQFKQAKVEDDCYVSTPGNRSGKGCTREMRLLAAQRDEAAQLEADEIFAHQVADWLLHAASDDRLGHPNFNSEIRKELSQAIAYASGYLRNLK